MRVKRFVVVVKSDTIRVGHESRAIQSCKKGKQNKLLLCVVSLLLH